MSWTTVSGARRGDDDWWEPDAVCVVCGAVAGDPAMATQWVAYDESDGSVGNWQVLCTRCVAALARAYMRTTFGPRERRESAR